MTNGNGEGGRVGPSDRLRFELCDIVYADYKGATFFLNHMRDEKRAVLERLRVFVSEHGDELSSVRGDSAFWYPRKRQGPGIPYDIFSNHYKDVEGRFVSASEKGHGDWNEEFFKGYDYFMDPLKIMFHLACNDPWKMDMGSELAKEIVGINIEIFAVLAEVVGDPPLPGGMGMGDVAREYFAGVEKNRRETEDSNFSDHYKDAQRRRYEDWQAAKVLLAPMFSMVEAMELKLKTKSAACVRTGGRISP